MRAVLEISNCGYDLPLFDTKIHNMTAEDWFWELVPRTSFDKRWKVRFTEDYPYTGNDGILFQIHDLSVFPSEITEEQLHLINETWDKCLKEGLVKAVINL